MQNNKIYEKIVYSIKLEDDWGNVEEVRTTQPYIMRIPEKSCGIGRGIMLNRKYSR